MNNSSRRRSARSSRWTVCGTKSTLKRGQVGRTQQLGAEASIWATRRKCSSPPTAPPAWLPDPAGRHEYRWWVGTNWTPNVADHGVAEPMHFESVRCLTSLVPHRRPGADGCRDVLSSQVLDRGLVVFSTAGETPTHEPSGTGSNSQRSLWIPLPGQVRALEPCRSHQVGAPPTRSSRRRILGPPGSQQRDDRDEVASS